MAGVLEDGDVRRIVRRFRSWRRCSALLEARAAFSKRCGAAVVRRRCVEAFSVLKARAACVRASRRGAAAALCVAALKRGVRRQIRAALKSIGWTAVGLFRSRKENKNEFSIMVKDPMGNLHHIKCARKPHAIIERTLITA